MSKGHALRRGLTHTQPFSLTLSLFLSEPWTALSEQHDWLRDMRDAEKSEREKARERKDHQGTE